MRVFSGIRPSGQLHIGNYLGAIKQWALLQEREECVFCIVDLHAITTPYVAEDLQKNIKDAAIVYLAAGLDPKKCLFFVQSQVPEHAELAWLLSTVCPVGELQRMTQYKEKSKELKDSPPAGLLNYPILMAADILLYQANLVPVGKDQKQHIELARFLARRFNKQFGKTFPEPKALISKTGAKIMSLQNPKKKMSKTDDEKEYIALFDEPDVIKEKIMAAVTDSGKTIKYDPQKKPGLSNLLTIFSLLSDKKMNPIRSKTPQMSADTQTHRTSNEVKAIEKRFQDKGYVEFKKALANLLIKKLEPFRQKKKEFLTRETYLKEILEQGRKKAQIIAQSTIQEAKRKMGLF